MSLSEPRAVPFQPDIHHTSGFDCGNEPLNMWLTQSAVHAKLMGTAHTYVFVRGGTVLAYYSLSAHQILSSDLPQSLRHGYPAAIPAYLIGKLAVTKSEQGKMMGHSLLTDALLRLYRASEDGAGARFIAVDAIDDKAMKFYVAEKFIASQTRPKQLFTKMSTVRKLVTRG